jgi:CRISPR system Cascade subunit CasA
MINNFNLIDEPWIPTTNGLVSLHSIFTPDESMTLGGTPVQKVSIMKLLLAIAQSASTPQDDYEWKALQPAGLSTQCLDYLAKWHSKFYLYGDEPFLQMTNITAARLRSLGDLIPEVSTGNTTVLTSYNIEQELNDAEKALLLVQLCSYSLGGKKADNDVVLSPGHTKKKSGKPGLAVGGYGMLHNYLISDNVLASVWMNMFTQENIQELPYPSLGIAPWEKMPEGEACSTANDLKKSLIGRLLPMSHFCLYDEGGIRYTEGIVHYGVAELTVDPSVAINVNAKKPTVKWAKSETRPWRSLTAMLSFIGSSQTFNCYHITYGLRRAVKTKLPVGVWSGGIQVSFNAGEQYVSGMDDYVESMVYFPSIEESEISDWFTLFESEMHKLEKASQKVFATVSGYHKDLQSDTSSKLSSKVKAVASNATDDFWQLCEGECANLMYACKTGNTDAMKKTFAKFVGIAYNNSCPSYTARQISTWAKFNPTHGE